MTINTDYLEVTFFHDAQLVDILPTLLTQIGFDSFLEEETGVKGYIETSLYTEKGLDNFLKGNEFTSNVTFKVSELEKKNWNEEWEKGFDPVFIDDQILIKAPFHNDLTDYPLTLIIKPRMSFGTGHHETTHLILKNLLEVNLEGKSVADIGCGTGVLSIAARKLGAEFVDACDIDQWSYENSIDNQKLNDVDRITFILGDVNKIIALNKTYDVVLANINKNILLDGMTAFGDITKSGGYLLLSGFYESDCGDMLKSAAEVGFELIATRSKNNWTGLIMEKL
jgi:ribosomal protein L11 methyltransferase